MKTYLHVCMHLECVTCSIFIKKKCFKQYLNRKIKYILCQIHFCTQYIFKAIIKRGNFNVMLSCHSKIVGLILVVVDKQAS